MYFIVYEIYVFMYLYFVLFYDYFNLNFIVIDFGIWIRVEDVCWYFILIWFILVICVWMFCDCKVCMVIFVVEGDLKFINLYFVNI